MLKKTNLYRAKTFYKSKSYNFTNNSFNAINKFELINKYINLNKEGTLFFHENNYSKSLSCFNEALTIAEELNDDFKINESRCNLGIIYFELNNFKKASELLSPCYNSINILITLGKGNNSLQNLILLCKSGCNLCMCKCIEDYEKNESISIINNIIFIISKENDINTQIYCTKYIIRSLFKVDSLLSQNNNDSLSYSDYDEDQEETNKLIKLLMESFVEFVSTQKFETWIFSLNNIYQKMERINYNHGLINILFHLNIAKCLNQENKKSIFNINNSDEKEAKINLINLLQKDNMVKINEEYINNIIFEYKLILLNIIEIYKMIYSFENKISKNMIKRKTNYYKNNSEENEYIEEEDIYLNIKSKYFLTLLLKLSKNFFENNITNKNLKKNLIDKIDTALEAINNNQTSGLDFSQINLFSLDEELTNYLSNILFNFIKIIQLNILRIYFYKIKSYKKFNKLLIKKGINFEDNYFHIYNGELIEKINFRSTKYKTYYYRINNEDDEIKAFINEKQMILKRNIKFYDILKILIGIKTKNLENKLSIMKYFAKKQKKPYLFMSLILSEKTVDLVFKDGDSAKKWFYGLYYYLSNKISKRPFKICSCTNFIFFKMKCKIMKKLKVSFKKNNQRSFVYYFLKYEEKYDDKKKYIDKKYRKVENQTKNEKINKDKLEQKKIEIFYQEKKMRNSSKNIQKPKFDKTDSDNSDNSDNYINSSYNNEEKEKSKKINKVLENMCIMGKITKIEIQEEKMKNPENFIETKKALESEKKEPELFVLGLLSKNLENIGVETAIQKENKISDDPDADITYLQYIINGYVNKKKYDLHFDFGKERNDEILNDENEYNKFKKRLIKKLSKDYNISEDKIIVTFPQKGSVSVQVIFQSDEFNNLNLEDFKRSFKNDNNFQELQNLKTIHESVVMEGCKLSKSMLDSRGNRSEGWAIGENRGGKPYKPPTDGWIGLGLKVLDRFDNGDNKWIGMINGPGEWCVAYHGVGRGQENVKYITKSIINDRFKPGSGQAYKDDENMNKPGTKVGEGVYCTPDIDKAEIYSGKTKINGKNYYTVLMVRVKPSAIRQSSEEPDYWVVNGTTDEIRPYRILYKSV